jgi:hypothetical protein
MTEVFRDFLQSVQAKTGIILRFGHSFFLPKSSQFFINLFSSRSTLYRVSQEERSIFCEVIVSVILRKKVCMNMCPIPNGFRYLARSILNLAPIIFLPSRHNAPQSEARESV